MFKVICINENWKGDPRIITIFPVFGNIYTVIDIDNTFFNKTGYALQEINPNLFWDSKHFAQVSEIDETEFERNYNKELI